MSIFLATLAVVAAQTSGLDPDVLFLSKAIRHIGEGIRSIPNYTCVETIDREQLRPPSRAFKRLDLVRLEVAKEGRHELFAWPGARKFEDRPVTDFVGGGLIGDGAFSLFADDIFLNHVASSKVHGPEEMDGRSLVRVDYSIHSLRAPLTLRTATGQADVTYSGSWWVDPKSLDLVRLDVQADEIPAELRLSHAHIRIEYEAADSVLPQHAAIEFAETSGAISRDEIEFAHCRRFSGDAVLLPDAEDNGVAGTSQEPAKTFILPGNLTIELRLRTGMDPRTASVGDPVTAVVERDVKDRQRVWLPKGSVVHGRVRRLGRGDGYELVGLEFSEADVGRDTAEFVAQMEATRLPAGVDTSFQALDLTHISLPQGVEQTDGVENFEFTMPGVAFFYLTAAPFRLPAGLHMVWKTSVIRHGRTERH